MEKIRKLERIVALTKILSDNPYQLFSLGMFSEKFNTAKSTLSEDITTIKNGLDYLGLGTLETLAGAAGGVRFLPCRCGENEDSLLEELAKKLASPDRIVAGSFIYMSDILFEASLMAKVGEVFMTRFRKAEPDYIMTVETKGIPLALMTAKAFHIPLVMVRRGSKVTEGSTVSINYVTGSSKRIQTMSLPKRAIHPGARVLIIDDFMKAGGTAKGMLDLANEVGARVVGTGVLVATTVPEKKLVDEYVSLLMLHEINEHTKNIDIRPAFH
jgi:purine operon repressor